MLKTQQLFKELGWKKAVEVLSSEPLNIQVKEYPDFLVLNYNQIFSPDTDEYVMECRSLQLDKEGNVISRSFPRFFNHGQHPEISGQFVFGPHTSFYEKADGSMVKIYWNPFDSRWECCTRGTAYAESEQNFYPTFRQAIIEDGFGFIGEEQFQTWCENELIEGNTYVFEYCSMKNNIVTPYEKPEMVLLTVIDNETGSETSWEDLREDINMGSLVDSCTNVRLVNRYKFPDYETMKATLDNLPGLQEGFVAQDHTGLRVKFKADLYLKLHRIRGDLGFTEKKIAEIVAQGEEDEVLTYFGQYKHLFDPIIHAREALFDEIQQVWSKYSSIEDRKEFALKVKDLHYSALLFTMKNRNKTFQEAWTDSREEYRVELIISTLRQWDNTLQVICL